MTSVNAQFIQRTHGSGLLFTLDRFVKNPIGHVIFIQGLFEELNTNRHVFTRVANQLLAHNFHSTLFDYYGTGDSQGDFSHVTFASCQQDIIQQIERIKQQSNLPVSLIAYGTGALLLTSEILAKVSQAQLWQAELVGKTFIKQLQRLSLLNDANQNSTKDVEKIELSGYPCHRALIDDFNAAKIDFTENDKVKVHFLECIDPDIGLGIKASKLSSKSLSDHVHTLDEQKYWLASELVEPEILIAKTIELLETSENDG